MLLLVIEAQLEHRDGLRMQGPALNREESLDTVVDGGAVGEDLIQAGPRHQARSGRATLGPIAL